LNLSEIFTKSHRTTASIAVRNFNGLILQKQQEKALTEVFYNII
jgi:hypothetical protein